MNCWSLWCSFFVLACNIITNTTAKRDWLGTIMGIYNIIYTVSSLKLYDKIPGSSSWKKYYKKQHRTTTQRTRTNQRCRPTEWLGWWCGLGWRKEIDLHVCAPLASIHWGGDGRDEWSLKGIVLLLRVWLLLLDADLEVLVGWTAWGSRRWFPGMRWWRWGGGGGGGGGGVGGGGVDGGYAAVEEVEWVLVHVLGQVKQARVIHGHFVPWNRDNDVSLRTFHSFTLSLVCFLAQSGKTKRNKSVMVSKKWQLTTHSSSQGVQLRQVAGVWTEHLKIQECFRDFVRHPICTTYHKVP